MKAVETSHGKIDDGLEEMKVRVASLTFQIDVNAEEMRARVSAIQYTVDAWKEEMKAVLEARTETGQEPKEAKIKTDLEE